MKKRAVAIIAAGLLILYVTSYAYLYRNSCPAANLMYFCYVKGGEETEGQERALYYFYYPVYKIHTLLGSAKHNYDRPKPVEPSDP